MTLSDRAELPASISCHRLREPPRELIDARSEEAS